MPSSRCVGRRASTLLVLISLGFLTPSLSEVMPPPRLLSAFAVSGTTIAVHWEEVDVAKALYLVQATADEQVEAICSCTMPCSSCTLVGLRVGTTYIVSMEACNDEMCTSSDHVFEATTVPGVPGPPTNVSVVLHSPTQVKIHWDPPKVTNGEIANYTAIVLQPYLFKCTFRGSGNGSCMLYDLFEGLTYYVGVRACNYPNENGHGGGCGQLSPRIPFTTWTGHIESTTLRQLTPRLGRLPIVQETTQAMIILPFSALKLNVSGPFLFATIVVHSGNRPENEDSTVHAELAFEETVPLPDPKHEIGIAPTYPIEGTYRNNTNGTWEVLVIKEFPNGTLSLPDMNFVLGDGLGRPKKSHLYNGPLEPGTVYTVKLRFYFQDDYFGSLPLFFRTKKRPVTPLIVFGTFGTLGVLILLGFFILLACRRQSEYAMLLNESRDAGKNEEEDSTMHGNEWSHLEGTSENALAFRPVRVNYVSRTSTPFYNNQRIPPVAIESFSDYTKRLVDDLNDHVNMQYRLLEILSKHQEQYCGLTTHFGEQFPSKTRHPASPPYDQTVVVLDRSWAQYQASPRTVLPEASLYEAVYIDASYVTRCEFHLTEGSATVPDFGNVPEFIAATTPLEDTRAGFLTMVAQQCSPLIVHLDNLCETEQFPLQQYWPDRGEKTFSDGVRSCNVLLTGVCNNTRWISRILEITPFDSKHRWTAEQMQILSWSTKRSPRVDLFYELVQAFLEKMTVHSLNKKVGPPIIHASSTDGRAGTFICAVILLQQLHSQSNYIDVFGTVLSLRKSRADLVNDKNQLEFLYRFMSYCVAMTAIVDCPMPTLPEVGSTSRFETAGGNRRSAHLEESDHQFILRPEGLHNKCFFIVLSLTDGSQNGTITTCLPKTGIELSATASELTVKATIAKTRPAGRQIIFKRREKCFLVISDSQADKIPRFPLCSAETKTVYAVTTFSREGNKLEARWNFLNAFDLLSKDIVIAPELGRLEVFLSTPNSLTLHWLASSTTGLPDHYFMLKVNGTWHSSCSQPDGKEIYFCDVGNLLPNRLHALQLFLCKGLHNPRNCQTQTYVRKVRTEHTGARNINVSLVTPDSIQVYWEPSDDEGSASYRYYAYLWRDTVDGGSQEECVIPPGTENLLCTFQGLQPNTNHFFVITTCTPLGYCNHIETPILTGKLDVDEDDGKVSIENIRSDAVRISLRSAAVSGDYVFRVIVDGNRSISCPQSSAGDKHACYVCGLQGDRTYTMQVFNCTPTDDLNRCHPYTSPQTVTTPPGSPQNVTVGALSSDSVSIAWTAPNDDNYGMYDYSVDILTGRTDFQHCEVYAGDDKLSCEFHELQPGAIYTIAVKTSAASRTMSIPSLLYYPQQRPLVEVMDVSTDSFILIWNAPESLAEKNIVVYLNDETGPACDPTNVSANQRFCLIDGLDAGTVYKVQLFSAEVLGTSEFDFPVTRTQYILTRSSASDEKIFCPVQLNDSRQRVSPQPLHGQIVDLNHGSYQHCELLQAPYQRNCLPQNLVNTNNLESIWICLPDANYSSSTKSAFIQAIIEATTDAPTTTLNEMESPLNQSSQGNTQKFAYIIEATTKAQNLDETASCPIETLIGDSIQNATDFGPYLSFQYSLMLCSDQGLCSRQ
ncbi:hypothetical protein SprV_0802483600 [Sparganum proliferum]